MSCTFVNKKADLSFDKAAFLFINGKHNIMEQIFFLDSKLIPVPKINGISIGGLSFRSSFKFYVDENGIPNFTCISARVK